MRVLLVGGRQRSNPKARDEWSLYAEGAMVVADLERGVLEPAYTHRSPPDLIPPGDQGSVTFKAATRAGDRLYACTQTELLVLSFPGLEREDQLSLPRMNDVHHVRPTEQGTLLVANTGLDMVFEVSLGGEVVGEWSTLDESPWARFSRDVDYRRLPTTKPHRSHPNYVFELDGEPFVTRFEQRDAVSVRDRSRRIAIGIERPHDGIVHGDSVYFTTVDGHVVVASRHTRERERVIPLAPLSGRGDVLGWCRSLHVIEPDRLLVGFSRIRPTRFEQNLLWVRQRLGGNRVSPPTRVALYDLARGRLERELDVEPAGLHAIFSIHPLDD